MKPETEAAIDRLAHDAAKSVEKHKNISISAWNYGLQPTKQVLARLREYGLDARVADNGFMGYIHFKESSE